MEDNVALDSAKQKQFVKSVRGIKKLLKKKGTIPQKAEVSPKKETDKKDGKIKKRKKRGLVYLSHIPHGFYEHEMTEYFKQFGVVTNARVIRSRRTGNSKGYAFVEFKQPTVAEIVADTMNNYLMGKRLIKAVYVPPAKQKRNALRKNWNYQNNPLTQLRHKLRQQHNADKSDIEELKVARKMLFNLDKTKKKLSEIGIDYDFFKPVDVPMELTEEIEKKTIKNVDVKPKEEIKDESVEKPKVAKQEVKSDPELKGKKGKKGKNNKKSNSAVAKVTPVLEENEQIPIEKQINVKGTKKQQKDKQAKLDKAGVKALEDFIKVKEDSNVDSDSSVDFDSDEYEKMIENDNDDWSEEESESKIDEGKEKVKQNNKKINKTKPSTPKQQDKSPNKQGKPQNKKANNKSVQHPKKRKQISLLESLQPKNAKFEKQNKTKALNKVIKKRNETRKKQNICFVDK